MKKFWTITSEHTTHTNDRSTRFGSFDQAEEAAINRLGDGKTTGVFILEAVAIVKTTAPPTETIRIYEDIEPPPHRRKAPEFTEETEPPITDDELRSRI